MNNILLYGCSGGHLSILILVASSFWQLQIKLLQTLVCTFLCRHKFSDQLGKHLKVYDKTIFSFLRTCQSLPMWLYGFASSSSMNESSYCFTYFPAIGIAVFFFNFSCSNRCMMVTYCFNLKYSDDKWCWAFFSYAYFLSIGLPWWDICSGTLLT